MPAAAVVGAAKAFRIATLLPLNMPANKPLMYCNQPYIAQTQIRFDNDIYSCDRHRISVSCIKSLDNTSDDECLSQVEIMECDIKGDITNIYCTDSTQVSRHTVYCDSTTVQKGRTIDDPTTVLNCFYGKLSESLVAVILTTPARTFLAQVHVFFLKLIGKEDLIERVKTTFYPLSLSEEDYESQMVHLKHGALRKRSDLYFLSPNDL